MLDSYDKNVSALRSEYQNVFLTMEEVRKKHVELVLKSQESRVRAEFIKFQLDEIEKIEANN
jgi:DNA repair ATPase RecN